jgi:hypothetical protein
MVNRSESDGGSGVSRRGSGHGASVPLPARWVDWFDHQRLHSAIGDIPPAEHETSYYAQTSPNRRLKKRTKADRNGLYAAALGSAVLATVKEGFAVLATVKEGFAVLATVKEGFAVLATVKEGFAVAPSVEEIRVLVVSKNPQAFTPATCLSAIYAARFRRETPAALEPAAGRPGRGTADRSRRHAATRGAAQETLPLGLSDEPDLTGLMERLRADLR